MWVLWLGKKKYIFIKISVKERGRKPPKEGNRDFLFFGKDLAVTDRNSQGRYVFQVVNNFIKNFCSENKQYFPCEAFLNATEDSNIQQLYKGYLHCLQIFSKWEVLHRIIKNHKLIPWRTMLWFISFVAICKERRQLHVKILFRSAGKELLKYQLPYHRFHKGLFKGCCVFPCMRLFIRVERICLTEEVQRIYKKIDRHGKFLRFVTIIYLESISLHTLFHFQRSLLF